MILDDDDAVEVVYRMPVAADHHGAVVNAVEQILKKGYEEVDGDE